MLLRIACVLACAALLTGQGRQTSTGVITDSECATAYHGRMRMGPTDPGCVIACVRAHGASYVLYTGKEAFDLSDQNTPEKFAGKKVTVTGTVDAKTKTIKVESITAAN
jgi:hypothetical protein